MYDLAPPPVHPYPSFFETTVVNVETPDGPARVVTHLDIEAILRRKPWDVRDTRAKAEASMILRGWKKNVHGVMVAPPLALPAPRGSLENGPKPKPTKKAAEKKAPGRKT